jgi:hypothetical protein
MATRLKSGSNDSAISTGFLAFAGSRGVGWFLVFAQPSRKDAPPQLREGSSPKPILQIHNYTRFGRSGAFLDSLAPEPG